MKLLQTPSGENLTLIFDRIDKEINKYALAPQQRPLPSYMVRTGSHVKFLWAPKLWILLQMMRVRHDTQWAR